MTAVIAQPEINLQNTKSTVLELLRSTYISQVVTPVLQKFDDVTNENLNLRTRINELNAFINHQESFIKTLKNCNNFKTRYFYNKYLKHPTIQVCPKWEGAPLAKAGIKHQVPQKNRAKILR